MIFINYCIVSFNGFRNEDPCEKNSRAVEVYDNG